MGGRCIFLHHFLTLFLSVDGVAERLLCPRRLSPLPPSVGGQAQGGCCSGPQVAGGAGGGKGKDPVTQEGGRESQAMSLFDFFFIWYIYLVFIFFYLVYLISLSLELLVNRTVTDASFFVRMLEFLLTLDTIDIVDIFLGHNEDNFLKNFAWAFVFELLARARAKI